MTLYSDGVEQTAIHWGEAAGHGWSDKQNSWTYAARMTPTSREENQAAKYGVSSTPLRTNALAKFISNGAIVSAGFISATITARALGASGKGTLSTILYIATVSSLVASLAVGDAATVLAGGDKKQLREMAGLALPLVLLASIPAVLVLLIAAWIAHWSQIWIAVLAACLLVPVRALSVTLIGFQNALERFVRTSLIMVVQVAAEVIFLVAFVIVFSLDVAGGVIASVSASLVAVYLSVRGLVQDELLAPPRWALDGAKRLIRVGGTLTSAQVIAALAQRFDLVLVYTLLGQAPAGRYAIALSLGQLASYTSNALSVAAFPRLARIDDEDGWRLLPRISRMSLASSITSAGILAMIAPLLIPTLFGSDFGEATGPTIILLLGGILWSELSTLTRSVAALGHQRILLATFLIFLILMGTLDLLLIPRLGIMGAALASTMAATATLCLFTLWYIRRPEHEPLLGFLPGMNDAKELYKFMLSASIRAFQILRHPRKAWSN